MKHVMTNRTTHLIGIVLIVHVIHCVNAENDTACDDIAIPGIVKNVHTMYATNGWAMGPFDAHFVPVQDLLKTIYEHRIRPVEIALEQVCYKGMGRCEEKLRNKMRVNWACTDIPGILVKSSQHANPCGKPYRMLDGGHRICKMLLRVPPPRTANYFVLTEEQLVPLIRPKKYYGVERSRWSLDDTTQIMWYLGRVTMRASLASAFKTASPVSSLRPSDTGEL